MIPRPVSLVGALCSISEDGAQRDPKYALYCWGPDVPRNFIENKEAPTL